MIKFVVLGLLMLSQFTNCEADYTDVVKKLKDTISDPQGIFYHAAY